MVLIGGGAVGTALAFEHLYGYVPCALCLEQRWPYYVGVPIVAATGVAAALRIPEAATALMFLGVGALFLYGAGLGAYHAGIEWGYWTGPDCTAGASGTAQSAGDLLDRMRTQRIVPCDVAAWRLYGISMAGYNALVSLLLAGFAVLGAVQPSRP